MTSFWWLILFFINLFVICSLRSVICKKYTNGYGKDSKYTNAIDIRITGSCGGGVGSADGRVVPMLVALVVSLFALAPFSLPFFASFKILSFNLCSFLYLCELDVLSIIILK